MRNVITISAVSGSEDCQVDVNMLHEVLLQLPAEKYIALYRKMEKQMEGTATNFTGITSC